MGNRILLGVIQGGFYALIGVVAWLTDSPLALLGLILQPRLQITTDAD